MSPYWLSLNLPPLEREYTPEYFGVNNFPSVMVVDNRIKDLMEKEEAIATLYNYYKFETMVCFFRPLGYKQSVVHRDTVYIDNIKQNRTTSINITLLGEANLHFLDVDESKTVSSKRYNLDDPDSGAVDTYDNIPYLNGEYKKLDTWNVKGWGLINPSFCHVIEYLTVPRMILSFRNKRIDWETAIKDMDSIIIKE